VFALLPEALKSTLKWFRTRAVVQKIRKHLHIYMPGDRPKLNLYQVFCPHQEHDLGSDPATSAAPQQFKRWPYCKATAQQVLLLTRPLLYGRLRNRLVPRNIITVARDQAELGPSFFHVI
jgi:hypothetical protein